MSRARAATVSTDTDEAEILKNHLAHAKTLLREALRCLHTGDELPIAALAARAPDCLEARVYRFLYPQIAELNAETSGRTR